LFIQQC